MIDFTATPAPSTMLHPIDTVLTAEEKNDLDVFISAGAAWLGFNRYGPGLGEAHPIRSACRRLGLDVSAFR